MIGRGQLLLRASFNDIERLCAEVRAWNLDFKPLSDGPARGDVADLVQMRFGEIDLSYARFRAAVDQTGEPPRDRFSFTILSPRTRYLWWRGRDVVPEDVLVFRSGAEFASVSGADFESYILSVPEDRIRAVAEREGIILPVPHRRPEVFRPPGSIVAAARATLHLAMAERSLVTEAEIRELAERLILAWLAWVGLSSGRPVDSRKQRALTRGLELLHATPRQQIPVDRLCVAAGASRRTLESAFLEQYGFGPAAFMKRRRLADARRVLQAADPRLVRVSDIMEELGFAHVGQFAADYRRVFGELPSETLGAISRAGRRGGMRLTETAFDDRFGRGDRVPYPVDRSQSTSREAG